MASYLSNLRTDVARWRQAGLIDAATGEALLHDAQARHGRGISFGAVLSVLAATLVGAALLLFVAANWEAFPRMGRVILIYAGILIGYMGGATLKSKGHVGLGEALWLLAAVAFGAGIALVAQMYQLSGDEAQAILVWCAGTMLAAIVLRSHPLTVGATLLSGAWLVMVTMASGRGHHVPVSWLALAALLWAVSLWTASEASRHLLLLGAMAFAGLLYLDHESLLAPGLLVAASVAVFGAGIWRPDESDRLVRLGGGLVVHGLLGFIAGMSAFQLEYHDEPEFIFVAIAVFAGIIATLVLAGRGSRMLRWLAYAAFVYELGFIYVALIGTMLDTASFFLAAGLVLAVIAVIITRIERRMARPAAEGEARP